MSGHQTRMCKQSVDSTASSCLEVTLYAPHVYRSFATRSAGRPPSQTADIYLFILFTW